MCAIITIIIIIALSAHFTRMRKYTVSIHDISSYIYIYIPTREQSQIQGLKALN